MNTYVQALQYIMYHYKYSSTQYNKLMKNLSVM